MTAPIPAATTGAATSFTPAERCAAHDVVACQECGGREPVVSEVERLRAYVARLEQANASLFETAHKRTHDRSLAYRELEAERMDHSETAAALRKLEAENRRLQFRTAELERFATSGDLTTEESAVLHAIRSGGLSLTTDGKRVDVGQWIEQLLSATNDLRCKLAVETTRNENCHEVIARRNTEIAKRDKRIRRQRQELAEMNNLVAELKHGSKIESLAQDVLKLADDLEADGRHADRTIATLRARLRNKTERVRVLEDQLDRVDNALEMYTPERIEGEHESSQRSARIKWLGRKCHDLEFPPEPARHETTQEREDEIESAHRELDARLDQPIPREHRPTLAKRIARLAREPGSAYYRNQLRHASRRVNNQRGELAAIHGQVAKAYKRASKRFLEMCDERARRKAFEAKCSDHERTIATLRARLRNRRSDLDDVQHEAWCAHKLLDEQGVPRVDPKRRQPFRQMRLRARMHWWDLREAKRLKRNLGDRAALTEIVTTIGDLSTETNLAAAVRDVCEKLRRKVDTSPGAIDALLAKARQALPAGWWLKEMTEWVDRLARTAYTIASQRNRVHKTDTDIITHFLSEVEELAEALAAGDESKVAHELAGFVVLAASVGAAKGIDMGTAVRDVIEHNRVREDWK